jgi:hypothetical protein
MKVVPAGTVDPSQRKKLKVGSRMQRWLHGQPVWQTGSQVLFGGRLTLQLAKGP